MTSTEKDAVFKFLDRLRESSVTNMLGAAPYIEDEFGIQRRDARDLLVEWMQSFVVQQPRQETDDAADQAQG